MLKTTSQEGASCDECSLEEHCVGSGTLWFMTSVSQGSRSLENTWKLGFPEESWKVVNLNCSHKAYKIGRCLDYVIVFFSFLLTLSSFMILVERCSNWSTFLLDSSSATFPIVKTFLMSIFVHTLATVRHVVIHVCTSMFITQHVVTSCQSRHEKKEMKMDVE